MSNVDLCFKRQIILSEMSWMFSPPSNYNAFRIQKLNQLNESNIEYYANICSTDTCVNYVLARDKPFIGIIIESIDAFKLTQQNKHELLSFTRAYRSLLKQPLTTLTIALMNLYDIVFEFLYDNFDNIKLNLNDLTTDSNDNTFHLNACECYIDIDDNGNHTLVPLRK